MAVTIVNMAAVVVAEACGVLLGLSGGLGQEVGRLRNAEVLIFFYLRKV